MTEKQQQQQQQGRQPRGPAGRLGSLAADQSVGWLGFCARAQLTRWQTLCLNWRFAALLCYFRNLPVNFKQTKAQTLQMQRRAALRRHHNLPEQLWLRLSLDLMTLQRCKHTA